MLHLQAYVTHKVATKLFNNASNMLQVIIVKILICKVSSKIFWIQCPKLGFHMRISVSAVIIITLFLISFDPISDT